MAAAPDSTQGPAQSARRRPAPKCRGCVPYGDLLGVPFRLGGDDPARGLDCWGQAAEIGRRIGRPLGDPDRSPEGLDLVGRRWQDATELGDIVASDPEGVGEPTHCSTLVNTRRHLVLSCSERQGPFVVPAWHVRNVVGVWRVRP